MIETPVTRFIFAPFFFSLAALFACHLYYAVKQGPARIRKIKVRIYRCVKCAHVYIDQRDVPMSCCPRCETMNEAVKR